MVSFKVPLIITISLILLYSYMFEHIYMIMTLKEYITLGLIVAPLAIMSDLLESFLKRCANVKVKTILIY